MHRQRVFSATMSIVAILGVAAWYWRPTSATPLLAIGSALLLAFVLWKAASGLLRR